MRTIEVKDDNRLYRKVLESRARNFNDDNGDCIIERQDSPIFDILKVAILYGLYNEGMNLIFDEHF